MVQWWCISNRGCRSQGGTRLPRSGCGWGSAAAACCAGSADGVDPAEGVGVPLLLQACQLVVQLQSHGAGLAGLAKLAAHALVGERAHGGHNHGRTGGEDLQWGMRRGARGGEEVRTAERARGDVKREGYTALLPGQPVPAARRSE